jgi:hypothetical protein
MQMAAQPALTLLLNVGIAIGLAQRHMAQFKGTHPRRWVGLRMQRSSFDDQYPKVLMISTRKTSQTRGTSIRKIRSGLGQFKRGRGLGRMALTIPLARNQVA